MNYQAKIFTFCIPDSKFFQRRPFILKWTPKTFRDHFHYLSNPFNFSLLRSEGLYSLLVQTDKSLLMFCDPIYHTEKCGKIMNESGNLNVVFKHAVRISTQFLITNFFHSCEWIWAANARKKNQCFLLSWYHGEKNIKIPGI